MYEITFYWKHDGEDIDLGTGYHQLVPPKGTLVAFVCEHGVVWRVVEHYYHMVMEGSATLREWRLGHFREGGPVADVFVEPAQGPFEP